MTDKYKDLRAELESLQRTTGELRGPEAQAAALLADYDRLRQIVEMAAAGNTEYDELQAMAQTALAQEGS